MDELKKAQEQSQKTATSEAIIREAVKKLENIMDSMIDGVTICDMNGYITYMNNAAIKQYGYTLKECLGKTPADLFIDKKDIPKFFEAITAMFSGKSVKNQEFLSVRKDGTQFPTSVNISALKNVEGKPIGIIAIHRDITEKKINEEEKNKLLRKYGERIKELNCLYGISELVEKPNISIEEILQGTTDILQQTWQYPEITCVRITVDEKTFKTKNFKETRWKQSANIKVHGKNVGSVEVYCLEEKPKSREGPFLKEERHLINAVTERMGRIIERKKSEEEIRIKNSAIGASINAIALADLEGKITYVNHSFLKMWGFDKFEDVLGNSIASFWVNPGDAVKIVEALQSSGGWIGELVAKRKDGSPFNLELSANMVTDEDGKPICLMASFIDITERKKTEEMLQNTTDKWLSLTENTDDTIVVTDNQNIIRYINKTIPPTTQEGVIGTSVYEYVSKEHHDVMRKSLKKVYKTGEPDSYEVTLDMSAINPELGTLWFRTKLVPIKTDKEISGVIMIATDITERKRAEEEIRMLSNVVHQTSEAIAVSDFEGKLVFANEAWAEMHGYETEELTEVEISIFYKEPEIVKLFEDQAKTEGSTRGRIAHIRKNGRPFATLSSLTLLKDENGKPIGIVRIVKDIRKIVSDIRDVGILPKK